MESSPMHSNMEPVEDSSTGSMIQIKSSVRVGPGVYKGFNIMAPPAWAPQNLFNHDIGLLHVLQPGLGE